MYLRSFKDSPELLDKVISLVADVFSGMDALGVAEALGLDWAGVSTPFVKVDGGRVVSHVGVLSVPMVIEGREVAAAGVHAVCTHPDHRRRGHYHAVMGEAMKWCAERFETALLFTDQPELYEPFGFRVIRESCFVPAKAAPGDSGGLSGLRKLDWSCGDDVALLRRIACKRSPVSRVLGVASEPSLFAVNAARLPMWYSRELDAVVSLSEVGDVIRVYDVAASTVPSWEELAWQLPAGAERVELCFCPDGLGLEGLATPAVCPCEDYFMARGPFGDDSRPRMFPRTAEF